MCQVRYTNAKCRWYKGTERPACLLFVSANGHNYSPGGTALLPWPFSADVTAPRCSRRRNLGLLPARKQMKEPLSKVRLHQWDL